MLRAHVAAAAWPSTAQGSCGNSMQTVEQQQTLLQLLHELGQHYVQFVKKLPMMLLVECVAACSSLQHATASCCGH
jgi:hypothetical protein